jgi:exodeoxyribonuclease V beta subunit
MEGSPVSRYPKPALLASLPPRSGVVQASAGTGKTYLLERMVVDFLLQEVPLDRILVVTYTDKAALELRTRIRQMLDTLVALDPDQDDAEDPAWTLGDAQRTLLRQALRSFDQATIATIHGFCRRILMEGAFEGGTLLRQELADGAKLFEQAFRELVRVKFKDDLQARKVFEEALEAEWSVDALHGLLDEANRERGRLRPEPPDLEAVLGRFDPAWLTAGPEVAAQLQACKLNGSTRTAAIKRLPVLAELMGGRPSPFVFLAGWDFAGLRDCCLQLPEGSGRQLGLWLEATGGGALPVEALVVQALLPAIQAKVAEIKAAQGLFDHDDSILQVLRALKGPTARSLVDRIQGKYRIALIDEFQDTDQAQWEIFQSLFDGPDQRLYIIGDPKQAIYGFRGGDLPTYHRALETILGGDEPLELRDNYRSTPQVIEACNDLFTGGDTPGERFFEDGTIYPPARAVRCGNPGLMAVADAGQALAPVRILRIRALKGGNALRRRVAAVLAREIRTVVEAGVVIRDPAAPERDRRLHYGDVQVLVGTMNEGRLVAKALGRIGVPCVAFKQKGLFQSDEARDLLDLLRAVERPNDPGRRARALLTPFFGYRLADLDGLGALTEDHPVVQKLQDWHQLGRQRQFPLMLEAILERSGLVRRLRLDTGNERALTNFLHLAELLASAGSHGATDLEALVRLLNRWVEKLELPPGENAELQRLEGQEQAVQILTLHASKGLEAGIVAVFALSPGRKPALFRFYQDGRRCYTLGKEGKDAYGEPIRAEENGEQERLMYVALTRAKAQLILPCFLAENAKGVPAHPPSAYQVVNRRLRAVALDESYRPDLFSRTDVEITEDAGPGVQAVDLRGWTMPALPAAIDPDFAEARRRARPAFTTSYSALERHLEHRATRPDSGPVDLEPDAPGAEPAKASALPRGAQTGQAIHELIEPEDTALALAEDFPLWWQDPARKARVRAKLAEHGLSAQWDEEAARMVQAALRVPLPTRNGEAAPLGVHDHLLREMGFLARFPDTADFLAGFMDAVFQRGEFAYFLDWKTNSLDGYSPEAIAAFVQEHFAVQAKIYTRVLLDYLGILDQDGYERRFGGIHYVFLRESPPAVHTFRPTWAEVQGWEQDFRDLHQMVTHV